MSQDIRFAAAQSRGGRSNQEDYCEVLADGEPDYEQLERYDEGRTLRYGRLILPLSDGGARIAMFLIGRYALKS